MQRRAGPRVGLYVIRLDSLLLGQQFLEAEGLLIEVSAAVLGHLVDRRERVFARSQRVFIRIDFHRVGGHRSADCGELRHRRFVVKRQGRAGGEHCGQPPEIPARKAAFHEIVLLLLSETDVHEYTSRVMQVLSLPFAN